MAALLRKKRVTDPLNEEARARLVGAVHFRQLSYGSSGSEHSSDGDGDGEDNDSLCLSELVHDFLEDNERESSSNELESDRLDPVIDYTEMLQDILREIDRDNVDPYKKLLVTHVSEAAVEFAIIRSNVSVFRRNVMTFLREQGHNAAICKTKWDSSGGVTAGDHEFIDVVQSSSSPWQNRYFIELDFPGQFEIARATSQYSEILCLLPEIFVGTADELKRTVRGMCDVVKKCLRSRGLSVPPWRKNRYMQKKWLAPYRRTTNPVQGNPVPVAVTAENGANCRLIGFNDVAGDQMMIRIEPLDISSLLNFGNMIIL